MTPKLRLIQGGGERPEAPTLRLSLLELSGAAVLALTVYIISKKKKV